MPQPNKIKKAKKIDIARQSSDIADKLEKCEDIIRRYRNTLRALANR
jgi:hypothetical protein